MRTALVSVLMTLSLTAAACKKKEADKAPDPAGSGETAGSAMTAPPVAPPPAVEPPPAADKMSKRGGNCPSMVVGSTTAAATDATAVTVTILATDADAIASIQRRTEELLEDKAPAAGSAHDQKGSYGGSMGLCPVVTVGATAKMEKNDKGVTVVLTPTADSTLDKLKATVEERIRLSAEYVAANIKPGTDAGNGAALGGGKGDHGSNHSGKGDGKGKESGKGDGTGGGKQDGTGGGKGSGGGQPKAP